MLIAKLWNDGEPDILPVTSPDCYITVICLHLLAYLNTGRYVCASHCVFYAHISLNLNIIYMSEDVMMFLDLPSLARNRLSSFNKVDCFLVLVSFSDCTHPHQLLRVPPSIFLCPFLAPCPSPPPLLPPSACKSAP